MIIDYIEEFVEILKKRGIPAKEASAIVVAIGDRIEEDENGQWLARDREGNIFARVDPYF